MAEILEKRYSLHKNLNSQQLLNDQLKSQISRLQGLANTGMVSAMIAHEMNNILTPLENYAQLAINNPDDKTLVAKALEKTVKNSARAGKILRSMLSIASGRLDDKSEHNLKELIDEIFDCLGRDLSKDKIKLNIQIDGDITVFGQGICIQQVLMNLILNAREAMLAGGGLLSISATGDCDNVVIEVADTGYGVEQENLENIFEPFFTTKTEQSQTRRPGTGLGLAFCKKIVDAHNGKITVQSDPSTGTVFTLTIPKSDAKD
jgi:two-component system sensor kinase FixL